MASQTGVASGVLGMLKEDHEKVKGLFEEFEQAEGREKAEIAKTAIHELEVHAELEEKLIYPAIREEIDEDEMMNEAIEEHHVVKLLIAELKKLKASDERFEAKFSVLSEMVKHHAEEEEDEMFPKAEQADIDWEDLEARVTKRKEQLLSKGTASKGRSRSRSSKRSSR